MADGRMRLTDAGVARLKPRDREYTVGDTRVPALGVRVRPGGSRSWVHHSGFRAGDARSDGAEGRGRGAPGMPRPRGRGRFGGGGGNRGRDRGTGADLPVVRIPGAVVAGGPAR